MLISFGLHQTILGTMQIRMAPATGLHVHSLHKRRRRTPADALITCLAWPLRQDGTHRSESATSSCALAWKAKRSRKRGTQSNQHRSQKKGTIEAALRKASLKALMGSSMDHAITGRFSGSSKPRVKGVGFKLRINRI
eukprot:4601541-Amphidinium_carterae.1